MLVASLCSCHPQGVPGGAEKDSGGQQSSHKALVLRVLFWIGRAEAAKWKRSVVKINASALWWSAPTDLGISHSRLFLSWHHRKNITTEEKNNLLKTIRDRKEGLFIYTASGTKQDAVNNHSLAACDMVNAAIPRPCLCRCFLPHGLFKGRKKKLTKSLFLHVYSLDENQGFLLW